MNDIGIKEESELYDTRQARKELYVFMEKQLKKIFEYTPYYYNPTYYGSPPYPEVPDTISNFSTLEKRVGFYDLILEKKILGQKKDFIKEKYIFNGTEYKKYELGN